MNVNESNQINRDFTKDIDNKIRNEKKAKENELEKIKKIYDDRIEIVKGEGEESYSHNLKKNSDLLVEATHDYEKKLENYKDNLDQTQKKIANEEAMLKSDHQAKIKHLKDQFQLNLNDQFENAQTNQVSIQDDLSQNILNNADHARAEKNRIQIKSNNELSLLANTYNQKNFNEERNFRSKLESDLKAHESEIKSQKTELKKLTDQTLQKTMKQEEQKLQVQKDEISYQDNHHKNILAQKQADFKIRYENMVKDHDSILNDIKNHLDKDMKKMIASSSTQKRIMASKSDDPFYRVDLLNPTMIESEKEYLVKISIPEYEKENIHLSVQGREARITLTRRFSETEEAEDGSVNKSTKNELFSKSISSKDLLDPKSITQKFEDGILTFKIKKL